MFKVDANLNSLFEFQVDAHDVRVEEASRPLREEVAALKLLFPRVGDSFEPIEACPFDGLGIAKAQASVDSSEQKSSVVEEEHLYGCFSPRSPSPRLDVSAASEREGMDLIMAKTPDVGKSVDADTTVSLSPESGRHVVAESGVLTHVPRAFVAREICVFLATLAAAYPGCKGTTKSDGDSPDEYSRKKRCATEMVSAVA
jgi:hypothetical protein